MLASYLLLGATIVALPASPESTHASELRNDEIRPVMTSSVIRLSGSTSSY